MDMVHYLGYIIDRHGVYVDPTKIQVIFDWPTPTTLNELRSFLGCWQIQLTDSECLSLMATVKMTGKQKTSSER
jgi:hypothetical protein